MSKFCPFCDNVKDSELDTEEKFKQHIFEEHKDEVIQTGEGSSSFGDVINVEAK